MFINYNINNQVSIPPILSSKWFNNKNLKLKDLFFYVNLNSSHMIVNMMVIEGLHGR